jgi:cytochrome c oxidase subunit 3
MPARRASEDTEIILENNGGDGGVRPPDHRDGDGGDDADKHQPQKPARDDQYVTAVLVGMVSITVFFLVLVAVFFIRRGISKDWVPVHLPLLIWVNTAVLLISSLTLELARKRFIQFDFSGFRRIWRITTLLGILFLVGQTIAWFQLAHQGIFIATNPASSFFYIFTAAHAVHLIAGVVALMYISLRRPRPQDVSLPVITKAIGYYWHFLDGLWICLFVLLTLTK